MTNKQTLIKAVEKENMVLGIYDTRINLLNRANLKKIMDNFKWGSTDIDIFINRKPHVVEVSHVDDEIDFNILTKDEYIGRYGDERYRD